MRATILSIIEFIQKPARHACPSPISDARGLGPASTHVHAPPPDRHRGVLFCAAFGTRRRALQCEQAMKTIVPRQGAALHRWRILSPIAAFAPQYRHDHHRQQPGRPRSGPRPDARRTRPDPRRPAHARGRGAAVGVLRRLPDCAGLHAPCGIPVAEWLPMLVGDGLELGWMRRLHCRSCLRSRIWRSSALCIAASAQRRSGGPAGRPGRGRWMPTTPSSPR